MPRCIGGASLVEEAQALQIVGVGNEPATCPPCLPAMGSAAQEHEPMRHFILVAASAQEIQNMYRDLDRACTSKWRKNGPEKLQSWRLRRRSGLNGGHNPKVEALMVFFGVVLCWDRTGAVGHRVRLAWTRFVAIERQLAILSPIAPMQRDGLVVHRLAL